MIELEATYPGRTKVDVNDPGGNFLDSNPPGSFNGTPGKEEWARDMWGFLEKIRLLSGITPSGAPDSAVNSQRYSALLKISRDLWPLWDSTHTYGKGVIVVASDDIMYQSLQASNLNKDPVSNPAWWREFSAIVIVDDLVTADPTKVLSANQGVVLKALIDAPTPATATVKGVSLLPEKITIAPSGATSIVFSGGNMKYDDGTGQTVVPPYTKNLNASWAPGSAGGLDTGSVAINTTYFCYAISKADGSDADYIFTAAYDSPTFPVLYTKKEYRGPVKTDGAGNIRAFKQTKHRFEWDVIQNDLSIISATAAAQIFALPSIPVGKEVVVMFNINGGDNAYWFNLITSPTQTDTAPSITQCTFAVDFGSNNQYAEIRTNSLGQLRTRWSGTFAMSSYNWNVIGFKDYDVEF